MSLIWKLFFATAATFAVFLIVLATSPATVSDPIDPVELAELLGAFALLLVVQWWIVRGLLRPLGALRRRLDAVDSTRAHTHAPLAGTDEVRRLAASYNEMMARLDDERDRSTGRILQAQEEERRRLARELHDEIGQSLTLALMRIAGARDELGPAEPLVRAEEQVRTSLDEIRRMAARLRPGVLDELGLRPALTSLASELASHGGPRVERAFSDMGGLTADQELAVYRIAQEAVTNVARHADASVVTLTAGGDGRTFRLSVEDDGVGVDPDALASGGVGVAGMRERAQLVGGTLEIGPRAPSGTLVSLTLPLAGKESR